ncbi:MAG: metallophosphoesterase [Erysipelotrichaceae bacterium]|nr:metallophosphoesterase [Erysipelotrichaceae bacterium]
MTAVKYFEWILSGIFGFVLVKLIKTPVEKISKIWIRILLFCAEFFLMMVLAYFLIASASPFLWKYGYPLMGIYIALLADCFYEALLLFFFFVRKDRLSSFKKILSVMIMILVFGYGTINMQIIKGNRLTYASEKLKNKYTIVFLSDLHFGSSQSQNTVLKALNEIKELKPDCILLGGDITDEHTTKEEMEWLYRQLSLLEAPVYYIYGNHDRQDRGDYIGGRKYSEEELEEAITGNGIEILKDDYVMLYEDLVLLGREDISREDRLEVEKLRKRPADAYVICVDHCPYQNDEIIKMAADLQLSGHTHAGQFFPMKTVYILYGLNTYGNYRIGNTDLYVSSGISGWYLPFRNEAHCNYEIIELLPE